MYRSEGEEAHDGVFQLVSVANFLTLAGLSSEGTLGRPASGRLLGACLSSSDDLARRPESEEATMLAVFAARSIEHPAGTRCLVQVRVEKGIARGQELPADGNLDVPMLGIPLAFLGRIDVEVLPGESLRIERRLRIVHTKSLGRCGRLRK